MQWWSIWLMTLGIKDGWFGIVGPFTITFLILRVSGVRMLEKKLAANPAFADYKRRPNVLLPWFPRT